ncbi:MAG TPA: hypothetical protein PK674_03445 [Candidatus Absconditabacterales bacterium]|nr:hypothetical protein [Candidatus Absconditabacterales bacterium]
MKVKKEIVVQTVIIIFLFFVGRFLFTVVKNAFFNKQNYRNLGTSQQDYMATEEEYNVKKYKNITEVINMGNCDIIDIEGLTSLGYKYIDIFSGEVYNPKNDYKKYTNQFYVQPGFEEAYLCVVANVIPSYQDEKGKFYLGILFNDPEYQGLVNVAYNKSGTLYDYTSKGADSKLTGRMYGLELKEHDKIYRLDLNGVIVGNKDGGYKIIKPIDRLNLGNKKTLRIGGFISAGEKGVIKKFRIFYKGGFIDNLE